MPMSDPKQRRSIRSIRQTLPLHANLIGSAWILGALFLGVMIFNFRYQASLNHEWMMYAPDEARELWQQQQQELMNLFLLQCALFAAGGILLTISVAHRIGGTYLALIRTFDQVRKHGTSVRMKFRRSDHLESVSESLNQMLEQLDSSPYNGKPRPPQS